MKLWGIPAWAWATGIAIGCVIGLTMFDGAIVGLIFGLSIGTVFAIAFSTTTNNRKKTPPPTSSPGHPPAGPDRQNTTCRPARQLRPEARQR